MAFLRDGGIAAQRLFMDAAQTLLLWIEEPGTGDLLDAMKMHRIRLAIDKGLRAWEPPGRRGAGDLVLAALPRLS